MGRRRTGTRHGNVYRSVRENQGNVVYQQLVLQPRPQGVSLKNTHFFKGKALGTRLLVLQTVRSLRVVSLVFRGHDPLKIANINPQQEATLSLWKKKLVPRESGGKGNGSWSSPKRRFT